MQCSAKRRLTLSLHTCLVRQQAYQAHLRLHFLSSLMSRAQGLCVKAYQRRPARTLAHLRVICRRRRRPSHYCSACNVARPNMRFIDSHLTRLQRQIAYAQSHTSCSLLMCSLRRYFSWHLPVRVLRTWHCPSSLGCPFLRTRYPPQPHRV